MEFYYIIIKVDTSGPVSVSEIEHTYNHEEIKELEYRYLESTTEDLLWLTDKDELVETKLDIEEKIHLVM